jgi:hypothetical protein
MLKSHKIGLVAILFVLIVFSLLIFVRSKEENTIETKTILANTSMQGWTFNYSGAEINTYVNYNVLDDYTSRFCVEVIDSQAYESALSLSNQNISAITITEVDSKDSMNKLPTSLDLSSSNKYEDCFEVTYKEFIPGMSFKIGNESIVATSNDEGASLYMAFTHHVIYDPNNQRMHVLYIDDGGDIHSASAPSSNLSNWTDGIDIYGEANPIDYEDFDCVRDLDGSTTYVHCVVDVIDTNDFIQYIRFNLTGTSPFVQSSATLETPFDSSDLGGDSTDDVERGSIAIDSDDCVLIAFSFEDDSVADQNLEKEVVLIRENISTGCGDGDFDTDDIDNGFPMYDIQSTEGYGGFGNTVGIESFGNKDAQIFWINATDVSTIDFYTIFFNGTSNTTGTEVLLDDDIEGSSNSRVAFALISENNPIGFAMDDSTAPIDAYSLEEKNGQTVVQTSTSITADDKSDEPQPLTAIVDTRGNNGSNVFIFSIAAIDAEDIWVAKSLDKGKTWGFPELIFDEASPDEVKFLSASYDNDTCQVVLRWLGDQSAPYEVTTGTYSTNSTTCGGSNACNGGNCLFYSEDYLLADNQAAETFLGDTALWMKWNISDLCNLTSYDSIDTATLQMYITNTYGTIDNDSTVYMINNQSYDESWLCVSGNCPYNATNSYNASNPLWTSITANTFTNLSLLEQVQQSCLEGNDTMVVQISDTDHLVVLSDISHQTDTATIPFGDNTFLNTNTIVLGSRDNTNETIRPKLFVTYTPPTGQQWEFVSPENGTTNSSTVSFNMSILSQCGSGGDALILEVDGVNETVCENCPASTPGYYQYNKTDFTFGTHNISFYCNGVERDIINQSTYFLDFHSPTPTEQVVKQNNIYFNMSSYKKCGTGDDALIIDLNGTNQSVCSNCPSTVPGFQTYNKTSLSDGNYSYFFYCNGSTSPTNYTYLENDNDTLQIIQFAPANNTHWTINSSEVNLSCQAYAPSGVANVSLIGDFKGVKYNMSYEDKNSTVGGIENVTINFTVTNLTINDTYNWRCEMASVLGNHKITGDRQLNVGTGKVYVVYAVDTESEDGADFQSDFPNQFNITLDLTNYDTVAFSGQTGELFDPDWRASVNDSNSNPVRISWYMMTHEAHCVSSEGCNVIPNIMFNGDHAKSGNYPENITYWNDSYNWHNHHSYWNGTNETDPSGQWLQLKSYNGTEVFYRNGVNETDIVRAEKLVSLFNYENQLAWESFRAGWLWSNVNYNANLISVVTAIDFSGLPLSSGNYWNPAYKFSGTNITKFRLGSGTLTNNQTENAFSYAANGSRVVIGAYGHNYGAGMTGIIDDSAIQLENSSSNHGVEYEYVTALEAAKAFFRIEDDTAPNLTLSVDGDYVIVDSTEELYGPPVISININDGTTTNYTLETTEVVNGTQWRFNNSEYVDNAIGYRARGTDKGFNVAIGDMVSSITITTPTTETPAQVSLGNYNITVGFKFYALGSERTSNVTLQNITVGGIECNTSGHGAFAHNGTDWVQNCTVDSGLTGLQDLIVTANHTLTPDISETEEDAVLYDTCTYGGSGNWAVNCSDNCTISSNVNLGGNNISIVGFGTFLLNANITNYTKAYFIGLSSTERCTVSCVGGHCFKR